MIILFCNDNDSGGDVNGSNGGYGNDNDDDDDDDDDNNCDTFSSLEGRCITFESFSRDTILYTQTLCTWCKHFRLQH